MLKNFIKDSYTNFQNHYVLFTDKVAIVWYNTVTTKWAIFKIKFKFQFILLQNKIKMQTKKTLRLKHTTKKGLNDL